MFTVHYSIAAFSISPAASKEVNRGQEELDDILFFMVLSGADRKIYEQDRFARPMSMWCCHTVTQLCKGLCPAGTVVCGSSRDARSMTWLMYAVISLFPAPLLRDKVKMSTKLL